MLASLPPCPTPQPRRGGAGSGPLPRRGSSRWRPASASGWLPFAGRSLSPDEAGYLIVGAQWGEGACLYGDYWVDRPPGLIAIFEAADALGGTVPLRLIGALAAVLTVVLAGVLGRLAAPGAALRSGADGRHGRGVRGHAALRRQVS